MAVRLDTLSWQPKMVSYLGAVQGSLKHLGVDVSDPWLYGGTGLAFSFNFHGGGIGWAWLCAAGCQPKPSMVHRLAPNVGFSVRAVCCCPANSTGLSADEARAAAWDLVRQSLDRGLPCLGFHMDLTEFGVINGYDDVGYYYQAPGSQRGGGPLAWERLGDDHVGWVHVEQISPHPPAPDDVVVCEASDAVAEAMSPADDGTSPNRGPEAFWPWADGLEQGTLDPFERCHSPAYWAECRTQAVGFWHEAKERLPGRLDDLFDEAGRLYQAVADRLIAVSQRHPFTDAEVSKGKLADPEGAALLREAAEAETDAYAVLGEIAEALR